MKRFHLCKKYFGYTFLWTYDKKMQGLLFAYCEGRSALWRMFLGWRMSTEDDQMFFWIPSRKLKELIEIAEKF